MMKVGICHPCVLLYLKSMQTLLRGRISVSRWVYLRTGFCFKSSIIGSYIVQGSPSCRGLNQKANWQENSGGYVKIWPRNSGEPELIFIRVSAVETMYLGVLPVSVAGWKLANRIEL